MLSVLDSVVAVAGSGVAALAGVLSPVLGGTATAGAIVVFTLAVRLLMLPLSRASVRSAQARAALRPRELELRQQFRQNPGRQRRELAELHRRSGVSPFGGIAPALAQAPFFLVLYRLFASPSIGGHANVLLTHTLFGVPLGDRFTTVGFDGLALAPDLLVYAGVFALIGVVAWWSSRQARRAIAPTAPQLPAAAGRIAGLLPYGTVVVAGFVPLAAAVYLLTSTAWSATERSALAGRSA